MSTSAIITTILFVAVIVLLIWQPVHPVVIGAFIPSILAALGIIDAKTAYAQFANTTVVFFVALGVVGQAFFKTGLADLLGEKIIGFIGKGEKGIILGSGLVAGGLSAFMNDTGSTACLMPIVSSMGQKAGVSKSKLLMSLAFFASLGGTITLIGTTPHIVVNGLLADMSLREFEFFEYAKIGIPLMVAGMIYMLTIGTKLLPENDVEGVKEMARAEKDKAGMIKVGIIFIAIVVCMASDIIPMHVAGVLGAILVILTGCLDIKEAIDSFSVTTIFLVGGIFPLSMALVDTGAAEYFVNILSPLLNGLSPVVLIGAIGLIQMIITQFLLNSSATVLMLPIGIMLCQASGINPLAGAMMVSVCASGVFTTPFGTGPNLLVWEAGGYSFKDYFKCGFPLFVIFLIVTTALVSVFYL